MILFCSVRYFLDISYKGTNYHGWQIQPNAITVQEVLEESLNKILRGDVEIIGSGRTDTGVHASQQIAHLDAEIENLADFQYKLNSILPADIVINSVRSVKADAHARFDANKRSYVYHINRSKSPFHTDTSYYFKKNLNLELIEQACQILKNWTDFESFSKVHTDVMTFNCKISQASWVEKENGSVFHISADRFLRGMVRAVVGTLLDVGTGKLSVDEFALIEEKRDRGAAGRSAPAHGLFLCEVSYPSEIYLD